MNLPDYIPNIHPLLVHFPIALFCVAVVFHAWKTIFAKDDKYNSHVLTGYLITSLSLVATYFSGRNAADNVTVPDDALSALSNHADKALFLLAYSLLLTGLILFTQYRHLSRIKLVDSALVILGVIGLGLLLVTADAGGRLVYGYGVGVTKVQESPIETIVEQTIDGKAELNVQNDGSWKWESGGENSLGLLEFIDWLLGNKADLLIKFEKDGKTNILIESSNKDILFSFGSKIGNVKVDVEIDLSEFKGEIRLIHHLLDAKNYDYLSVADGKISIGQNSNGEDQIFESNLIESEISSLSIVGDGRHYRGYINNKMVIHAHATPLEFGNVGIYLHGNGKIFISSITVKNLKKIENE